MGGSMPYRLVQVPSKVLELCDYAFEVSKGKLTNRNVKTLACITYRYGYMDGYRDGHTDAKNGHDERVYAYAN